MLVGGDPIPLRNESPRIQLDRFPGKTPLSVAAVDVWVRVSVETRKFLRLLCGVSSPEIVQFLKHSNLCCKM